MKREDYFKYCVQGGDIYVLPEWIFDELFDELLNLQSENKQLREVIEKAIEYINGAYEMATYTKSVGLDQENIEDLLDILEEVE